MSPASSAPTLSMRWGAGTAIAATSSTWSARPPGRCWETDPSLRDNEDRAAFADVWCAIPKVVFSRTLDSVQGNARLAKASVAEEAAVALDATDKNVSIGGAGLAAAAIGHGLIE
jgi:hypothetical protein